MGGWNLKQSDWANTFKLSDYNNSLEEVLKRYEYWMRNERQDLMERLPELQGKRLGCWCKPNPCHGDVLIRLLAEHNKAKQAVVHGIPHIDYSQLVKHEVDAEEMIAIISESLK